MVMPIFYTPKPRQFHYKPRLYDPDLEDLERRKRLYAAAAEEQLGASKPAEPEAVAEVADDDLEYFQRRVRELDGEERRSSAALSWRDLFRKRAKPEFHYRSRLQQEGGEGDTAATASRQVTRRRMGRRFDFDDPQYFRPVSAGKIMLYVGLATALLLFIFF